jgi:hypothetical protein
VFAHQAYDGMPSCTRDLQNYHMSHLKSRKSGTARCREVCKFLLHLNVYSHFSNWGSRRPMTYRSTSTINLSPALAFPPIGSRSCRCSIIERTKSSSSSCAVRANTCTVCGSTVGYGGSDEEEVEAAIERNRNFPSSKTKTLAFEGNRERFCRVAEASRRASFIQTRPTKVRSESLRWKAGSQKNVVDR